MKTVYSQFYSALKEIRKSGVMARRNVSGCCRSCVDLKVAEDQAIIWHFGGQGGVFYVGAFGAEFRDGSNCDGVYFNHNGLASKAGVTKKGKVVQEIFAKHGIVIKWNESESVAIWVDFKATAEAFAIEEAKIVINTPDAVLV